MNENAEGMRDLAKAAAVLAGQLAVVALWLFIFYAYMLLTPDQMSAECEHEYYLMEQEAGK